MLPSKTKNDHGRGFKRTDKQWQNSICDHIGKFIDKLTVRDVIYGLSFAGAAFTAYQLLPKAENWLQPGTFQIAPFVYAEKNTAQAVWVAESMIAAYMVLKIDVDDVASAARGVSSLVTSGLGI